MPAKKEKPRAQTPNRVVAKRPLRNAGLAPLPGGQAPGPGPTGPYGKTPDTRAARVRTFRQRVPKASEILAHELLSEIVANNLAPGDRLPLENEMVERYGAGRSTVREALRILEINGQVIIRSGRHGGPVVGRVGPSDFGRMVSLFLHTERVTLGEIIEARSMLEPILLRQAVARKDPEFLAQVADLKQRALAINIESEQEYRLVTREFHELVALGSNNRPLALFGMALMYMTALDHAMISVERRKEVVAQHDQVLQAILDGRTADVDSLMVDHMDDMCVSVASRQPHDYRRIIWWK